MDVLSPVVPSTFIEEVGKGQFPVFVPFMKKSKAFPSTTYLFPVISNSPPLAARKVERISPTVETGKKKSLGNECLVSQLIVSTIDALNNL